MSVLNEAKLPSLKDKIAAQAVQVEVKEVKPVAKKKKAAKSKK